jgi:hypothetical protein
MRAVELLGPSGVGKTYLYNRLFDTYSERCYKSVAEACIIAATELKPKFEFTRHYLYYLMLTSGLFNNKAYGLSRKLLFKDQPAVNSNAYKLSYSLLQNYLNAQNNPEVSKRRMANFTHCLELDTALEQYLPANETVFFDEGALHHHHGLDSSVINKHSLAEIKADKAFAPHAVVFCELASDQLMQQVLKRRKQGIHTFSHKGLSENALTSYVEQNVKEYHHKMKVIEMIGVPVLTINTANDIQDNLQAVHSFINNLSKS